ncbi:DUF5317 family protein [Clostridium lacusfryxellense]|uniref:DUF5317 family protein n=1 Tax=Clostridium lacusfryxellense TaxID=205328 RepID=UPI001C0C88A7|nr:DUF5317 family protein [Clostridium lacusfryxellense]MBU3112993.1 DUF5317 domain-containing protein [Clostridium lacusfryxellense]
MIEPMILAFIVAKIKGYKIRPLFKTWAIYPLVLFLLMYVGLEIMMFSGNYTFIKYSGIFHYIYLLTFLVLIIKYKLNVSAIIGSLFILIGSALNNFVIAANNGKMPVFPTLSYLTGYAKPDSFVRVNDIHIMGSGITKYKFLSDVIDVGYCVMSIGDVFIRVFAFIIIYNTIKAINKTKISNYESLSE